MIVWTSVHLSTIVTAMAEEQSSRRRPRVETQSLGVPSVPLSSQTLPQIASMRDMLHEGGDQKSVLTPKPFGGERAKFKSWMKHFENFMIPYGLDVYLRAAVSEPQEPQMQKMQPEVRQASRYIYALLAALMENSGEGAIIVDGVTDANGFLAWRNLVREFAPSTADRQVAIYAGLLNPDWHEAVSFQQWYKMWLSWEVGIARYSIDTRKTIDDDTKIATLVRCVPDFVRDILKVLPKTTMQSYASLREALLHVMTQERVYGPTGVEAECEDDAQRPVPPRTAASKMSLESSAPSLEETVHALCLEDKGRKGKKGKGKGKLEEQIQKLQTQLDEIQKQLQLLLSGPGGEGAPSFSRPSSSTEPPQRYIVSSGLCFRCGQKGHIAAQCPATLAQLEEDELDTESSGLVTAESLHSLFQSQENP